MLSAVNSFAIGLLDVDVMMWVILVAKRFLIICSLSLVAIILVVMTPLSICRASDDGLKWPPRMTLR